MQQYGKGLLVGHLQSILRYVCDKCALDAEKKRRFGFLEGNADFLIFFIAAVHRAFDEDQPVRVAQGILADFAFATRLHLFENPDFVSFITEGEVPEFGNLVLAAMMKGSVSDAFQGDATFERWNDWKTIPLGKRPPSFGGKWTSS